MTELRTLYPEIEPFDSGTIDEIRQSRKVQEVYLSRA